MARALTLERQKLKQDAIRIRQELGWTERHIANHLSLPQPTIHVWLINNSVPSVIKNNGQLDLGIVHIIDCIKGMNRLPHEYADLVFADPPYNLGVDYGNGASSDRHDAYYDWCVEWYRAIERILKPSGAFYLMQYPEQCAYLLPRLRALRFTLQRWIVWHYPTNIGQSPGNWTRSHRAILFLTKGDKPAYFDGLADPQPYRNPTDKRIQENLKTRPGVVPYDVWLDYNLVKNVSDDKTSWPNQIPVALVERIVKVSCPPNGIVCDPFMGSGTTAVASAKNGRRWIGFDTMVESKTETEKRLGAL